MKCRRRDCGNDLTEDDISKGYEHCSSECHQANDDYEDDEYEEMNLEAEDDDA